MGLDQINARRPSSRPLLDQQLCPVCWKTVIFLAALLFLVFGEWKNEVRFKLDSSGIRKVNKTGYTATQIRFISFLERDHCWRNRTVGNRTSYDILVTGAGYSATGSFAKTFTLAGYPVGHEDSKNLVPLIG